MIRELEELKKNLFKLLEYKDNNVFYFLQKYGFLIPKKIKTPVNNSNLNEYISKIEEYLLTKYTTKEIQEISNGFNSTIVNLLDTIEKKIGSKNYYNNYFAEYRKKIQTYNLLIKDLEKTQRMYKQKVELNYKQNNMGNFELLSAGWANIQKKIKKLKENRKYYQDKL